MPSNPNNPSSPPSSPRFYCENLPHPRLLERRCVLDPDQTRHARKALRLKAGERIELFDGRGKVAGAEIQGYDSGLAHCRVLEMDQVEPPRPLITVAAAVPKGPRADEMVGLLSQFGADRMITLLTRRGEVEPRESKLERFSRAAVESAKQSGRAFVMRVDASPRPLPQVLAQEQAEVKLIATIGDFSLPDLPTRVRKARSVLVLIGPVGDWTDEEVARAREAGFASWTLGPNVLRVEAAAAAATAVLRYLALDA